MIEPTIAWPALLRLEYESDLTIVSSWEEWARDEDLSGFDEPGVLVATDGQVFELEFEPRARLFSWLGPKGFQSPVPTGQRMSSEQLLDFVRLQARALGAEVEEELNRLAHSHDMPSLVAEVIRLFADAL